MTLFAADAVIRNRLGLDPEALGPTIFPQAVEQRMQATGVTSAAAYAGLLAADPREADALAAELLVPESWFFRGGRVLFEKLAEFISNRVTGSSFEKTARILCVPCSTGDEPYSLAIALQDRLVPTTAYRIEGVDLSEAHLGRARAARFTSFSFREPGPDIRLTYFTPVGDKWELRPSLRQAVRFRHANLTDPTFLVGEQPFDLIMCRNLFIYLTPDARKKAVANLDRLLAPDGWLCLTPTEADRLPPGQFVPHGPPEFGLYKRANGVTANPARPASVQPRSSGVLPRPTASPPSQASQWLSLPPHENSNRPITVPAVPAPPPVVPAVSLEAARALADGGQLNEARAMCLRILGQSANNPHAYTLLGVINQVEGKTDDAAEALRKALYLDPDHAEALSLMIVICERKGDAAQAASFRKRLGRLARKESK
jgi:chemotaxis protein methyltransferase WspC